MALRNRPFRPTGLAALAGVAALGIAIAGCSPVETWRALSGASKNDPDPATAPFTGNLAAAEAAPYPNLASVPPPPSRATGTAERQKLAQALIAERSAAAALAGPPPGSPIPSAPAAAARVAVAPSPVAEAPASVAAHPPARAAAEPARRRAGQPAEPAPQESALQMPQVRLLPEPETARPPLPPPRLATTPLPAISPELPPAAVASAAPLPAPPPPALAPVAAAPLAARTEPKHKPAAITVATFDRLDRGRIEQVAALYKEQPGAVRVVAHAAAPTTPGGDPLAGYHAALERAQAVAKALAEAGIPASRIQTEANPAGGANAAARIEIQFLP